MKVLIIYRPNSEHGRLTEQFIHGYQQHHDASRLEVLNIDSREGWAMATLYDVVQYPAILVINDDGSILKAWEGNELPRLDDVASYVFARG